MTGGDVTFLTNENTLVAQLYEAAMSQFLVGVPRMTTTLSEQMNKHFPKDTNSFDVVVPSLQNFLVMLHYGTQNPGIGTDRIYWIADETLAAYLDRYAYIDEAFGTTVFRPRPQYKHIETLCALNYLKLNKETMFVRDHWRYFEVYYEDYPGAPKYSMVCRVPENVVGVVRHGVQVFWKATFNADGSIASSNGPTITMNMLLMNINNLPTFLSGYDATYLTDFVGFYSAGPGILPIQQLWEILTAYGNEDPYYTYSPFGVGTPRLPYCHIVTSHYSDQLLQDLRAAGKDIRERNILGIVKLADSTHPVRQRVGNLIWLEVGKEDLRIGMDHIWVHHRMQFAHDLGITGQNEIASFILDVVSDQIPGWRIDDTFYYSVLINGNQKLFAVVISSGRTNPLMAGHIITAYPVDNLPGGVITL